MREFVAVEVEPEGAARSPSPRHLTLRFLGEVDPVRHPAIGARLGAATAGVRPFRLRLEGVGAFPSRERPRVVWLGVSEGREELARLAERVREALAPEFGREPDPFVPHLTLFRVRSPEDRRAAVELLAGRRSAPAPQEGEVRDLLWKESVLTPRGAVHRTIEAFRLDETPGTDPGRRD